MKDQTLFVGSMGKEWTTAAGAFESYDPMYIKSIATNGEIQHINWVTNYKLIRSALEIEWPGSYTKLFIKIKGYLDKCNKLT